MDNITEMLSAAMANDVTRLNNISHNLANANTTGFKAQNLFTESFDSHLTGTLKKDESNDAKVSSYTSTKSGKLKPTGNSLDFGLQNGGYFVVSNEAGDMFYTRNGQFTLNENRILVHGSGMYVHGNDAKIELATSDITVGIDGVIKDVGGIVDKFKVVHLPDVAKINPVGKGLYHYDGNVEEIEDVKKAVKQKSLESSNVSSMDEMVKLIEVMRSFEAKQKIVSNYDQMVNSLIREISF